MLLPDTSVLLHAYNSQSAQVEVARAWWERTLRGERPVGLAWVVVLGFIRITTNRGWAVNPVSPAQSIGWVRGWLALPRVRILTPGEGHAQILFRLLEHVGVAGNLTTDAHLAALAIEHQAELHSNDADFARFPGLRWTNPLA